MKRIFQISLICLLLSLNACKKEASPVAAALETVSTGTATSIPCANPNAAVKLTQNLYTALQAGKSLFVKQVEPMHYIGEAIASAQAVTADVPCNRVMERFNIYLNNNRATFTACANANCKSYVAIYHDPCGNKIVFMVPPTNPNCGPALVPNQNCWTLVNGAWWQFDYTICIHD